MTGPLNATTFSTTVVPTNDFVNNGSKFWLALFDANGQGYFHSGPQGTWIPYRGGIPPEYGIIDAASMSVGFTKWNVTGLEGSQIYIGYGHSFEDMLANVRFRLVHTITGPLPARAPTEAEIEKMTKFVLEIIPTNLRSPSTFKVIGTPSWNYYASIGRPNEGAITVNFDSQNGFGALIRTQAICPAEWDDRGFWKNVLAATTSIRFCYYY